MSDGSRLRVLVLGVIVLSLFSALFARLWYLQVISGEEYAAAAEGNRVRTVPREAPRGRILDRRGRVLVDNRVSNVVAVSRTVVGEQQERVVRRLAEILRVPERQIDERLEDFRYADFRPIPVATDVDEATLLAIREREDELPGVEARQTAVRKYVRGDLAAHVLGYVGEINDEELEDRRQEGYRLGDSIGKFGVERAYETDLRGIPGVELWEVDRQGDVIRSLGDRAPQQGHDVQLSLDLDIQRAAEEALAEQIERVRSEGMAAPGGAVVALDASTGGVVAMASAPTFDPSQFVHGVTQELWQEVNDPENHLPLNNRAIQGLYPPASTFKVVTALSGITSGVVDPSTTIDDEGFVEIGGRIFRNAGSRAYGPVDLRRAITVSSDVYFYRLAQQIDGLPSGRDEEIQRIARLFGFGETSGVELPFEQAGRVPDREWKRRVNAENPDAFPIGRWYTGDTVNTAIGQGDLLATPLQLANAYAALANGGDVLRPHVGARVVDRFGSVVREIQPQVVSEVPFSEFGGARDVLLRGLRGVVSDEEGTAHRAWTGYDGPPVAGKTGTAQISGKDDSSLFVGMVPAEAPRYVVAAVVEEAGAGASVAAPIVRRVVETINETEADPDLPPIGTLYTPTPLDEKGVPVDETTTTAVSGAGQAASGREDGP